MRFKGAGLAVAAGDGGTRVQRMALSPALSSRTLF